VLKCKDDTDWVKQWPLQKGRTAEEKNEEEIQEGNRLIQVHIGKFALGIILQQSRKVD